MRGLTAHALMYHDVAMKGGGQSGLAGTEQYQLPWDVFVDHLDRARAAAGGAPATVEPRAATATTPARWLLTFDDGGASAVEIGRELSRRNWRGYFFVTTGLVGSAGFVDAEAIVELHERGHVIGSHSVTHPARFAALTEDETRREWVESVEHLSEIVGAHIRAASVPGGYYRRRVAASAARAGIELLFTSEPIRTARRHDGCLVVGRYSIRRGTTSAEAAAAAAGGSRTWLQQYVAWNLRKPAKAFGGDRYDRIRRILLSAPSEEPRA